MHAVDPSEPAPLPSDPRGTVVTLGTFDGVHLGHQEVLREAVARGAESGRRSVVVTFEPHPLQVVRPEAAPPLLTTRDERRDLLACLGFHAAVFLRFTPALQQYSARRFVEEILIARYGMQHLVIGYDHGFGRGREGSVDTMRELGEQLGFDVSIVPPLHVGDAPVSSTRIRSALQRGEVIEAARCLGRSYTFTGRVVHGDHRGRELGFPTANLAVAGPHKLLPAPGIYAAVGRFAGESRPGLLHLGPRPTFVGAPPSAELYLLDWTGDLYGATVEVSLCAYLRGIEAYASAEALVEQMRRDVETGRAVFRGTLPSACGGRHNEL